VSVTTATGFTQRITIGVGRLQPRRLGRPPKSKYVRADGPDPGSWRGFTGMAEGCGATLQVSPDTRAEPAEYRELDGERVLVLDHRSARAKTSGLELEGGRTKGATRAARPRRPVPRLVISWDRDRGLSDLEPAPGDVATGRADQLRHRGAPLSRQSGPDRAGLRRISGAAGDRARPRRAGEGSQTPYTVRHHRPAAAWCIGSAAAGKERLGTPGPSQVSSSGPGAPSPRCVPQATEIQTLPAGAR